MPRFNLDRGTGFSIIKKLMCYSCTDKFLNSTVGAASNVLL